MMKHLLTIVLCLTTLTGLAQEEKIKKKRVVERQSFVCRSHPRSQCHGTAADEGDRHPENPARHYDIA